MIRGRCRSLFGRSLTKIRESNCSLTDDTTDARPGVAHAGVVRRACVPENVTVKVRRFAPGTPTKIRLKVRKESPRNDPCKRTVPISWIGAVLPPDVGLDLETADFAGLAHGLVIVGGFNHAEGVELGHSGGARSA